MSQDGQTVAAICGDKQIRLWSLSKVLQDTSGYGYAQPIASLDIGTEARPSAFSPDGHLLATVGDDQAVHIWNTRSVWSRDNDASVFEGEQAIVE